MKAIDRVLMVVISGGAGVVMVIVVVLGAAVIVTAMPFVALNALWDAWEDRNEP